MAGYDPYDPHEEDPRDAERGPAGPAPPRRQAERATAPVFLRRPGGSYVLVKAGEPIPDGLAGAPRVPAGWDPRGRCWDPAADVEAGQQQT